MELDLSGLSREDKELLYHQLLEKELRLSQRQFFDLFPDEGPIRRELYPKHMEFFEAGLDYLERCFMAANRVGKTVSGGYEITCHLTGLYPDWWVGRRFNRPIRAWAAGKTNETTRDIIQAKLLGEVKPGLGKKTVDGTGIIPGECIAFKTATWKSGVPDLLDTIKINHVSGGYSKLGLKSFNQGSSAFEGTEQDVIWLDEEPPQDVYGECIIRLATTNGIIMITFTPLEGMSVVVLSFLPKEMQPDA